MKNLTWIVGALVVIGAGFYFFTNYKITTDAQSESVVGQNINGTPQAQGKKLVTTPANLPSYTEEDLVWRVEKGGTYEETMPHQFVFLDVKGRTYKVGESMACNASAADEPNEMTRATCWFAGGGDIYSVFKEDGKYIVKHKSIQESGGDDVQAPPETPYEVLFTLE